jgi:hypothetical protein
MTVPVISGCSEQMYAYVPGVVNVRWKVPTDFARIPLSQLPSVAVTLWNCASLLVQVTVPPVAIVTVAGVNRLFAIDTAAVAGAVAGGGVVGGGVVGGGVVGGGVVPAAVTTIVPLMPECRSQTYAYVPAVANVRSNVAPRARMPLSKLASDAVTVCGRSSLLFHITIPPAAIVTVRGVNVLPARVTVAIDGDVGGGVVVGGVAGGGVDGGGVVGGGVDGGGVAGGGVLAAAVTTTVALIPECRSQTYA